MWMPHGSSPAGVNACMPAVARACVVTVVFQTIRNRRWSGMQDGSCSKLPELLVYNNDGVRNSTGACIPVALPETLKATGSWLSVFGDQE